MMLRIGSKLVSRITGKPANPHTRLSFTFTEVMLTVVILSIGIIGVLRAYAIAVSALGASQTYLSEVGLAKNKMAEAELAEAQNNGLSTGESKGAFQEGYRNFDWKQEVTASPSEKLNIAKVTVLNNYANTAREFTLTTYAYSKEE